MSHQTAHRLAISLAPAILAVLASCGAESPVASGSVWPQADLLFQRDTLWAGGDGAYSCDLGRDTQGRGRVLWLFGDSFVRKQGLDDTKGMWFLRNSIAIQTGYNPATALMAFHWGTSDGHPGSFVPEQDKRWFWPGPCLRVGKKLAIIGGWLVQQQPGQWGYGGDRQTSFLVEDVDADPALWQPREVSLPGDVTSFDLGTAGFADDKYWYLYGNSGQFHDYDVARFALADVGAGDMRHPEFFTGGKWQALGAFALPADRIMTNGAPESSVHFDAARQRYVMAQTEGFGSTTLALRFATQPQGPWSAPHTFLRPPESFQEGLFVYAGKAHPELEGADVVMTYVPTQFDEIPQRERPHFYLPHFARANF